MSTLTNFYNNAAERRQQSLNFVGRERREIEVLIHEDRAQEISNEAFMSGLEDIAGVKQLA